MSMPSMTGRHGVRIRKQWKLRAKFHIVPRSHSLRPLVCTLFKLATGKYRCTDTGVSRRVRRTTWERSLKIWELQISCFEEFLGGENVLGLVPASLPRTLGYAWTFYAPTSPPPIKRGGNRGVFRLPGEGGHCALEPSSYSVSTMVRMKDGKSLLQGERLRAARLQKEIARKGFDSLCRTRVKAKGDSLDYQKMTKK